MILTGRENTELVTLRLDPHIRLSRVDQAMVEAALPGRMSIYDRPLPGVKAYVCDPGFRLGDCNQALLLVVSVLSDVLTCELTVSLYVTTEERPASAFEGSRPVDWAQVRQLRQRLYGLFTNLRPSN